MTGPKNYFDFSEWTYHDLLAGLDHVWEVLPKIKNYIRDRIHPNLKSLFQQGPFLTKTVVLYQGVVVVPEEPETGCNFLGFHFGSVFYSMGAICLAFFVLTRKKH